MVSPTVVVYDCPGRFHVICEWVSYICNTRLATRSLFGQWARNTGHNIFESLFLNLSLIFRRAGLRRFAPIMVPYLLLGFALTAFAATVPSQNAPQAPNVAGDYDYSLETGETLAARIRAHFNLRAHCDGQSCDIADLSGSTGRLPKVKPEGGGDRDFQCIAKYNPEGVKAAAKAPAVKKQPNGVSGAAMGAAHSLGNLIPDLFGPTTRGTFNGGCTPNILIFAKGTLETGLLGITVGPVLSMSLPYSFSVVGVDYTADLAGDYCLGLNGGMVAKDMLNQAAAKCPNSKIFLSGYSQGFVFPQFCGLSFSNERPEA
jgi:hypothetical protein